MTESSKLVDTVVSEHGVTRTTHGTFVELHPGTTTFHEGHKDNLDEPNYSLLNQCRIAVTVLWQVKLFLVFVPLTLLGQWSGAVGEGTMFFFSFFALIPLAALLGDFTEDICKRSNEVVGALINVTFGNATELIISFVALRARMFQLIKMALIGSVLGNMLLVLGTGLFLGGLRRKELLFSQNASNTYIPLLMLSVMSFLIPSGYGFAVAHVTKVQKEDVSLSLLAVSRQIAVVTGIVYLAYLYFQLVTHRSMFDELATTKVSRSSSAVSLPDVSDEDEDDETPDFTLAFAVSGLAIVSVLISYISDVLVDTVGGAARDYGIPSQFIGLILVPIVGNAAEHATAVIMAQRGRLDVAIGVALGSSIQIALFVMPALVLGGWVLDLPLDMNFHPYPTAVMMVCVLVASQVVGDGKSNWLEGIMLLGAYIMVAITVLNGDVMG